MTALELARFFHDTYERLAPDFGYEARQDTREFSPSSKNGQLMVAVCSEVLTRLGAWSAAVQPEAVLAFCGPFPEQSEDERTLRRLLALAYAGSGELYGDDGELQLGGFPHPIDFRRMSVAEIEKRIHARGMAKLVEQMRAARALRQATPQPEAAHHDLCASNYWNYTHAAQAAMLAAGEWPPACNCRTTPDQQPAPQPTDALEKFARDLAAAQTPLDPAAAQVLRENLHDLYMDGGTSDNGEAG